MCDECSSKYSISIHALREESDPGSGKSLHAVFISIHALREESDFTEL